MRRSCWKKTLKGRDIELPVFVKGGDGILIAKPKQGRTTIAELEPGWCLVCLHDNSQPISLSPSLMSPSSSTSQSFDWRSFPDYLSGPLTPTHTDPDHSPLNHSSSLPHSSGPIAMSFPVQTTYPYSFQDSHLPLQSQLPVNVNNTFSYPSPDLDFQHILDIPIGNHLLHDSSDSTQPTLLSHAERNHDAIISPVNDYMTPCHSPVDVRSPLDYPTPASLHHPPLKGTVVHTILPSSFPENHVINFDVSVGPIFLP